MNFKEWLNNNIIEIISQIFPDGKLTDLGRTKIWQTQLKTGQVINFSFYENTPNTVQVGFTVDKNQRKLYGDISSKDVASNKNLMPGTLLMIRGFKELSKVLNNMGIRIVYHPIDNRRDRIFKKIFSPN